MISTLHPYTWLSCMYCYWCWFPYYGKADSSNSGYFSVILWAFLILHRRNSYNIYMIMTWDRGIVIWFLCHMATQKASIRGVCDYYYYSCLCTSWHCHPYFILQLCYFSYFIVLWAIINISQYYHLAWFLHSTLNSIVIGQHYVCDYVHYPVPYCLWITLFMCPLNVVCLGELLRFKLVIVLLFTAVVTSKLWLSIYKTTYNISLWYSCPINMKATNLKI